jgi:hypothetical protein
MDKAKRARTAETPKQPSLGLKLRAPCLYPDRVYSARAASRAAKKDRDIFPPRPVNYGEREAEDGPVRRHHNIDQTSCRPGLGACGTTFHKQLLAFEAHRRDLFEACQWPLELASPQGAFLVDARMALRQYAKLLLLRM